MPFILIDDTPYGFSWLEGYSRFMKFDTPNDGCASDSCPKKPWPNNFIVSPFPLEEDLNFNLIYPIYVCSN